MLVPGLILAAAGGSATAAASPVAASPVAEGAAVRGAFCTPGYSWPAAVSVQAAQAVPGVLFALTEGRRALTGRRVRFSLSAFHAVGRSVWFQASPGPKRVTRLGYLDLDTDESGTVLLDRWLRLGAVPTAAVGGPAVLRAQLVGSETILASARVSVL